MVDEAFYRASQYAASPSSPNPVSLASLLFVAKPVNKLRTPCRAIILCAALNRL